MEFSISDKKFIVDELTRLIKAIDRLSKIIDEKITTKYPHSNCESK